MVRPALPCPLFLPISSGGRYNNQEMMKVD